MTERPTDAPGDDPGDDLVPTPDELAEESPDLTDAEIAAASDAAADEVEEAEAGGETLEEAEAYDAEEAFEDEEAADEDEAEAAPSPRGPPRRLTAAEAAARRGPSGGHAARAPKPTRTAFPIDPALRIKDPASAAFVIASIAVFLVIFLNAMGFGHGGAFTPVPTAAPIVSSSPAPSASAGASGSPGPSGTPGASASASAAPSAASSPAPSTSPAATGT